MTTTTTTPAPVLVCTDLRKRFGDRVAVDGVSFSIHEGECYGLLGPNGAGKTTTVRMVCGLLSRDGGDVLVAGRRMDERATEAKAAVGYVPQEVALYPDLTARENLRFFGRLYRLERAELAERVQIVLDMVGLADRASERIATYSGGMQRRLNIAAGLLHSPRLLVLDEPTVGVDPQSRAAILDNVEKLRATGVAVLYTTHYMEEAERLCDRVAIVDGGQIVAEGTHRQLVERVDGRDRIDVSATGDLRAFARRCRRLHAAGEVTQTETGVRILAADGRRLLPKVLDAAEAAGVRMTSVEVAEPDLESVFLQLTGRALRD